jgi:hypothetical protein
MDFAAAARETKAFGPKSSNSTEELRCKHARKVSQSAALYGRLLLFEVLKSAFQSYDAGRRYGFAMHELVYRGRDANRKGYLDGLGMGHVGRDGGARRDIHLRARRK